jgi:hypothetical protein
MIYPKKKLRPPLPKKLVNSHYKTNKENLKGSIKTLKMTYLAVELLKTTECLITTSKQNKMKQPKFIVSVHFTCPAILCS